MRILACVSLFTHAKDYVIPKWKEMAKACFVPMEGDELDIIVYGDQKIDGYQHKFIPLPGPMSEDMLMVSRDRGRLDAIAGGYDVLMWVGVDALWQSAEAFQHCSWYACENDAVIAPLICARTDASYPVCRRFDEDSSGTPLETQHEIDADELLSGRIIPAGFPQADATFIPRPMFAIDWADHMPWYTRVENGFPNLCAEEYWCYKAAKIGWEISCHTGRKAWHVDHDSTARMYPGINVPLETLTWP